MDIINMLSGKELDALVAEKVMGWEGVAVDRGGPLKGQLTGWKDGVQWIAVPSYSTDIKAAMEVVEKLMETVPPEAAALAICRGALMAIKK